MIPGVARRAVCLAIALLAVCADVTHGGTGDVLTLPLTPNPTARGLRLTIDTRWAEGYGYRPVRIDVTCVPPATADRTLSVELGLAGWRPDQELVTATDIEIPAGSKVVSRTLSVPRLHAASRFSLRVWEDGVPIEALSVKDHSVNNSGYGTLGFLGPRILFVADAPVDVSRFDLVALHPNASSSALLSSADVAWFQDRAAAQLPENWINYSGLDLAFVSLSEARDLAANRPAVWQALRNWTRSGGNLCLFDVGSDWHGLEEIEGLLGCPATEKEAAAQHRGWETPSVHVFNSKVAPAVMTARAKAANSGTARTPVASGKPVPASVVPFVWKPAGLGRAVALAEAHPFPGDSSTWRWLVESLGPDRIDWTMRQGATPDGNNEHFNDFLIADVGLPPIRAYQVLITLFAVGIGPVNYWILRRYGRLHLFLFTVPVAALVTSAALLVYALLADGLSSRLRARSLTKLDQRAGQAVRLARLSCYMGLAPAGGLTFPADTAITPLQFAAEDSGFGGQDRQLVWRDGQHLTRGWIRSRMPAQFVTTRADKTARKLAILSSDGGRTTVENRLGCHLRQLLLCDETGKLHYGEQIARDRSRTLEPQTTEDQIAAAVVKLSRELSRDRPALPPDMANAPATDGWFFSTARRSRRQRLAARVRASESLLEMELTRIAADVTSRALKPRSYVAIVERPEEIVAGADGLRESQSLHVIEGTW